MRWTSIIVGGGCKEVPMQRCVLLHSARMALGKHRPHMRRIILFATVWLLAGILYSIVAKGLLGDSDSYPSTGIPYDFPSALLITSVICAITGAIIGALEAYVMHRAFRRQSSMMRLGMKAVLYSAGILTFLLGINSIYLAHVLNVSLFHPEVLRLGALSLQAAWFWSIIAYVAFMATVVLLLSELQQHIGPGVLRNFFTGRYNTPKEEERIFMFLDMRSSTTIAEQMGHVRYFALLDRCFADMTDAITSSSGEITQYVGDEVVVTWTLAEGLRGNDCVACFFRIKDCFNTHRARYMAEFGRVPEFKAGVHCGAVATGVIGTARKDIVFSGDVMNTAARIQSLCNENGVDMIISETLLKKLDLGDGYTVRSIGAQELKGKDNLVELFAVGR